MIRTIKKLCCAALKFLSPDKCNIDLTMQNLVWFWDRLKMSCDYSGVLLWRQIWIVNYHVKFLSNENIKDKHWCFQISKKKSQKIQFGFLSNLHFVSKTIIWDIFQITQFIFSSYTAKYLMLCWYTHKTWRGFKNIVKLFHWCCIIDFASQLTLLAGTWTTE